MKTTDDFKKTIKFYLDDRAKNDKLFAAAYAKPKKNIDDCVTYILNTVQKSGKNGFTDDEVFGMAVHYYDEDDIQAWKAVNCKVVVNHAVEQPQKEPTGKTVIPPTKTGTVKVVKSKPGKKDNKSDVQQLSLFD